MAKVHRQVPLMVGEGFRASGPSWADMTLAQRGRRRKRENSKGLDASRYHGPARTLTRPADTPSDRMGEGRGEGRIVSLPHRFLVVMMRFISWLTEFWPERRISR